MVNFKKAAEWISKSQTSLLTLFLSYIQFLFSYSKKYIFLWGLFFESNKNVLVRFFLMKRGRYNRPFLHLAAMTTMGVGIILAPFLADTFPIFSSPNSALLALNASTTQESIVVGENV